MKILSFSVVEILPSLLNKKKVQTIRPAWETEVMKGYFKGDTLNRTKPPRFKVGDKVKLFWK